MTGPIGSTMTGPIGCVTHHQNQNYTSIQVRNANDRFQNNAPSQVTKRQSGEECRTLEHAIEISTARSSHALALSCLDVVLNVSESEQEKRRVDEECVVCIDSERTHALLPCGHKCICTHCASNMKNCPICRTRVVSTVRIYS